MYTTRSYHGADQPLGEYLSHVSLAPYPGFQTAWGKDACLMAATCMYMHGGIFSQKSEKLWFWYFFQKSYNYVLYFHFYILPPIKFDMDHTIAPGLSPLLRAGEGLVTFMMKTIVSYHRKKCSTKQIAAFVCMTKHHVN